MKPEKEDTENNILEILKSDEINNIYFNGFGLGVSKNDVLILLRRNGKPEVIINTSHITAKSFCNDLSEALKRFEENTNHVIPISEEIEQLMEEQNEINNSE
ncbi:hypothetical protein [Spirulina sp. 06S082]|uniref:hypothetical protein n=1 Tax=Spirulina sp. 06S082 TaxID=3110248 RepID=UPI002B204E1B|nr:hypothetical protein [Spirulina sp. 06S082]MEA5469964.1 hypothetical protein [Spirulina sp. 06S082]